MEPITLVKDAASCSACGACLAVCPKHAITMEPDLYGCHYPKIDAAACIHCGKCVQICGYTAQVEGNTPRAAYVAVGKCDALVKNSASGGIFASLAESCLNDGGMIAGAVLDCTNSHADVYHVLSGQRTDLRRMQGSKYVQSEAWRCYREVQQAVKAGKLVLFSGTPCQVMAVKQLTGDAENLVTVDLVCHGVPPVQMLNDYLKILARRLGGDIEGFLFRDKSGDKRYRARIDVNIGKERKLFFLKSSFLSFYKYFLDGSICRENCYSCPYACSKRVSDITIGDYWGVELFHDEDMQQGRMPRRDDWSCVLVNTEKGEVFLHNHRKNLYLYPSRTEWVVQKNQQLNTPSKKGKNREKLLRNYDEKGYATVESAFIRENGGVIQFHWRMLKNMRKNTRTMRSTYEN